jgi:hypothetical protein
MLLDDLASPLFTPFQVTRLLDAIIDRAMAKMSEAELNALRDKAVAEYEQTFPGRRANILRAMDPNKSARVRMMVFEMLPSPGPKQEVA